MVNEELSIEAKYFSDKSTFEMPEFRKYLFENYNGGFPDELSLTGLLFFRVSQENYKRWIKEAKICVLDDIEINFKEKLSECYKDIIEIINHYIDMNEDYSHIIALWIIGTYFHNTFESYPYLYFNAMKGSGKTKILKLITTLSNEGYIMASPTEAVLFRTKGTLGIDEFENVANKDKSSIRELLNASYKKGIKIFRMKKKKILGQEEQVVEKFEPYRPIVVANIFGMEEVLEDRCISLILEKSSNPYKLRYSENFENNEIIKKVRTMLNKCRNAMSTPPRNIYIYWDKYLLDREDRHADEYITTHTTHTHTHTQTTQTTTHNLNTTKKEKIENISLDSFFNKIFDSEITGRNLELFLPLFFLINSFNKFETDEIIKIAKKIINEKRHEEEIESRDVSVISFISKREMDLQFQPLKLIFMEFREFIDEYDEDINIKWFGRALKRLNLIVDKRRKAKGREVILNVPKAKENIKMFKK